MKLGRWVFIQSMVLENTSMFPFLPYHTNFYPDVQH